MKQGAMKKTEEIHGWGADLDFKNRPAVPKEATNDRSKDASWERPEQQELKVKVFHSIERPNHTAVVGTSTPPRGLSGKMRGIAYKFGEAKIHRWLLLLLADRVDMMEGVVEDLKKGHIPNIFSEMGLKSEWKYNRSGAIKKLAIGTSIIGLGALLLMNRRRKNHY